MSLFAPWREALRSTKMFPLAIIFLTSVTSSGSPGMSSTGIDKNVYAPLTTISNGLSSDKLLEETPLVIMKCDADNCEVPESNEPHIQNSTLRPSRIDDEEAAGNINDAEERVDPVETSGELVDVIIDAGSTGTRVYLFQHRLHLEGNHPCNVTVIGTIDTGLAQSHSRSLSNDPLKGDPHALENHLAELERILATAKFAIDRGSDADNFKVIMFATAGMRAYVNQQAHPKEVDKEIWDRVRVSLTKVFGSKARIRTETIDGRTEGMYSLLSVNFLAAQERIEKGLDTTYEIPLGALDLGGSSTQIALPPILSDNVREQDLVIKSFSGAGMKAAYRLLEEADKKHCRYSHVCENDATKTCGGDAQTCRNVIQERLGASIGEQMREVTQSFLVDGVIPGTFIAMSGYFYVIDFVAHLGYLDTVEPTWNELAVAVDSACKLDHDTVKNMLLEKNHTYTPMKYFSARCFQANYILKILEWYGFPKDKKGVAFKLKINDNEVEWPLGALVNTYRPNLSHAFS